MRNCWVLDTNVLVSALLSSGVPRKLLDAAINGDFQLCISRVLLAEFEAVLARPKFAARLQQGCLSLDLIVRDLEAIAFVVAPAEVRRMVRDDPADDYVIATALAGGADLIVTGDRRHLLPLKAVEGIPIVTAAEAVARLEVDDANS